jgi:hypothetical protein
MDCATQFLVVAVAATGPALIGFPAFKHRGVTMSPAIRSTVQHALGLVLGIVLSLQICVVQAEPVAVRYPEGVTHGFLVLRTLQGKDVADGDLTQFVRGDRVTRRLVFHFKDGSINDETVVFSQRGSFRLLSDRLIQKGPTFPRPMDVTIDGVSGQVKVRYTDDDGTEKFATEHLALPADVANGLMPTLLRNVPPGAPSITVSLVAATPKPQLVKLEASPEIEDAFSVGGLKLRATRYVVKVKLGGVAGLVAPLLNQQPPDSHVWIIGGDAPSFVKAEMPLFNGGPVYRIELATPSWP